MRKRSPLLFSLLALLLSACGSREKAGYYPTGEIKYRAPLNWQGLLEGEQKSFYKNGRIKRITPFYKNRITGLLREYYPNGQLASAEYFKSGQRFGLVKWYYPTGRFQHQATWYGSVHADTTWSYYPSGQASQQIIYDNKGRRVDFGVWHPNGQRDTSYTRPFFLSDRDTVPEGQDYAFEVVLGNRRSKLVYVTVLRPRTGVDSTQGIFSRTRFLIRRPAPGPHTVTASVRNAWARRGSDTIWIDQYKPISKSFWVQSARNAE